MRHIVVFFALGLVYVAAAPNNVSRIIGGNTTTVAAHPEIASILHRYFFFWWPHTCGGVILTSRAILTAAHCPNGDRNTNEWRVRVGSSYSNSGGVVYDTSEIVIHPRYNSANRNNDIAILRMSSHISFSSVIKSAYIPGFNFSIPGGKSVIAAGWGPTNPAGSSVEQLRHVEILAVEQRECAARYSNVGAVVTEGMLCAGWLDEGGRDTCGSDLGGPLYYGRVVVGLTSWGQQCALAQYPGVYSRVSNYAAWIQASA